jgi:ABC-type sugar transport system permease subunit
VNGSRRRAVITAALAAIVALTVLAAARWEEGRFARAGAVRIARSTAAYFAVVTPASRVDSAELDLTQLFAQARALATLPGWVWSVEIYHGTAPLVDAGGTPLPAAELERVPEWRDGAALVPLRGRSDAAAVVGVVAIRPARPRGVAGLLPGWGLPAALLAVGVAAAVAGGRRPRRDGIVAALILGLAAYADVRGAARRSTNDWLTATRLLMQEAATRLPGPRIRVTLSALTPLTLGAGAGGAELVWADSTTQEPRRVRVRGTAVAVVAARLGSGRWADLRTSPAEAFTSVWLAGLLGLALLGPLGFAALQWAERTAPGEVREAATAWAFLAPAGLHLAVFSVAPLLVTLYLAVHGPSGGFLDPVRPYVGLANLRAVVRDPLVWGSLGTTALYALYVPVSTALALAVALVLSRPGRTALLLRAAFVLPFMSSGVAVALVAQSFAGLGARDWLGSPRTALLVLMVLSVWTQVGTQMMVFLVGLRRIPGTYLDAARVDGANAWQRFRRVTFPLLKPITLFVLVTGVIGAVQMFTYVYVLTGGGPLHATDVILRRVFEIGWDSLEFGRASALSVLVFVLLLGVTATQFKLLAREGRVEHA